MVAKNIRTEFTKTNVIAEKITKKTNSLGNK